MQKKSKMKNAMRLDWHVNDMFYHVYLEDKILICLLVVLHSYAKEKNVRPLVGS